MLQELHTLSTEQELQHIYEQIVSSVNEFNVLCEDVDIPDVSDASLRTLINIMDDAEKKYNAAKRGLSIVSKLKPGTERAKHFSRITSNLNKLRGYNNRINKAVERITKVHDVDTSKD